MIDRGAIGLRAATRRGSSEAPEPGTGPRGASDERVRLVDGEMIDPRAHLRIDY